MSRSWVVALHDGQNVSAPFQVISRQLRSHRSRQGSYLFLVVGDRTGHIQAVLWDDGERWFHELHNGDIVYLTARCQSYQGSLQLVVQQFNSVNDGEYTLDQFLPVTTKEIPVMLARLEDAIAGVQHPCLQQLLRLCLDREGLHQFSIAPAARQKHHAYIGGLLEHTLEVLSFCQVMMQLHPTIDADILTTAALLHDIGKTREYRSAPSIEYTDEGTLIGHIVLADELVTAKSRSIPDFPPDLLLRLRHVLLSHHGQYEWQSPKRPKTLEAIALHLADTSSSQLALYSTLMAQGTDGDSTWTVYSKSLS